MKVCCHFFGNGVDRMPLPAGWLLAFEFSLYLWNSHGPFPTRFPRWLSSFSSVDSSGLCMAMRDRLLSSLECSVTIVYLKYFITSKARVFDSESGWRARWALPASQDKRYLGDWKGASCAFWLAGKRSAKMCHRYWWLLETFFGRSSDTWQGDGSTTVVWMVRVIWAARDAIFHHFLMLYLHL